MLGHALGRFTQASHAPPNREDWLITSVLVMLSAYLVANVVPFFEELTVLIGALIGGPISLGIPALFMLQAHEKVGALVLFPAVHHTQPFGCSRVTI